MADNLNLFITSRIEERTQPLTCEQLLEMSDDDREYLAMFSRILRNYSGNTSPAEEFIRGLVRAHSTCGLTPDEVEEGFLAEFRENFESMTRDAVAFARKYPDLILAGRSISPKEQVEALQQEGCGDSQQEAFKIENARDAIRNFPSLVLADDIPQPWRAMLDEFYAAHPDDR